MGQLHSSCNTAPHHALVQRVEHRAVERGVVPPEV
jgi:hypothetical protein